MRICKNTAFDGVRFWKCQLEAGHDGLCYAEHPFPEGEAPKPGTVLQAHIVEPTLEPPRPVSPPVEKEHDRVGAKRRPKYRDNVFAGLNDGVKTVVNWSGFKRRDYPTLEQLDGGHQVWG